MDNIDELTTMICVNNGLIERCLGCLMDGIEANDFSKFYECFSLNIKYSNHQGKEEVIKAFNDFWNNIEDKDMICVNVITKLRILVDFDEIIFIPQVYEFDRDETYDIRYKSRRLLLITDNSGELKRTAISLDFDSSGNIKEIEMIKITDACKYDVLKV